MASVAPIYSNRANPITHKLVIFYVQQECKLIIPDIIELIWKYIDVSITWVLTKTDVNKVIGLEKIEKQYDYMGIKWNLSIHSEVEYNWIQFSFKLDIPDNVQSITAICTLSSSFYDNVEESVKVFKKEKEVLCNKVINDLVYYNYCIIKKLQEADLENIVFYCYIEILEIKYDQQDIMPFIPDKISIKSFDYYQYTMDRQDLEQICKHHLHWKSKKFGICNNYSLSVHTGGNGYCHFSLWLWRLPTGYHQLKVYLQFCIVLHKNDGDVSEKITREVIMKYGDRFYPYHLCNTQGTIYCRTSSMTLVLAITIPDIDD